MSGPGVILSRRQGKREEKIGQRLRSRRRRGPAADPERPEPAEGSVQAPFPPPVRPAELPEDPEARERSGWGVGAEEVCDPPEEAGRTGAGTGVAACPEGAVTLGGTGVSAGRAGAEPPELWPEEPEFCPAAGGAVTRGGTGVSAG